MTEKDKKISQFCIAAQNYCSDLIEDIGDDENYYIGCLQHCIEKIHRLINPTFDKICKEIDLFEERTNLDESKTLEDK